MIPPMHPPNAPIIDRIMDAMNIERTSAPDEESDSRKKRSGVVATTEPRKPPIAPHFGLSMK